LKIKEWFHTIFVSCNKSACMAWLKAKTKHESKSANMKLKWVFDKKKYKKNWNELIKKKISKIIKAN